jgi:hypothetical protein
MGKVRSDEAQKPLCHMTGLLSICWSARSPIHGRNFAEHEEKFSHIAANNITCWRNHPRHPTWLFEWIRKRRRHSIASAGIDSSEDLLYSDS